MSIKKVHDYPKVPQCRICSKCEDNIRIEIDRAIIAGKLTKKEIVHKYSVHFTKAHKLTTTSVTNHKKHFLEYVSSIAIAKIEKAPGGHLIVTPTKELQTQSFIEKTAADLAVGIVDEDSLLTMLIIDGAEDIELLNDQLGAFPFNKGSNNLLNTKNEIRKGLVQSLLKKRELTNMIESTSGTRDEVRNVLETFIRISLKTLRDMSADPKFIEEYGSRLRAASLQNPKVSKYL